MRTKIIKKNGRCFIEMPSEIENLEELEIFKLKDGFYLVSAPLENPLEKTGTSEKKTASENEGITNEERAVITKLLSIKFEQRTPKNVAKMLNQRELLLIKELERKGFVNVFKGKKYAEGVYNISDKIYSILHGQNRTKGESAQAKTTEPSSAQKTAEESDPLSQLNKRGYAILNEKEAFATRERIKESIKNGSAKGLKGFDGNYYLVDSKFFSENGRKILKVLDKDRSIEDIAKALKMNEEAVKALLVFLAESGEVIEKRKGIYAAV